MSREALPGLYVHIPFCRTKCPYCDFYSETSVTQIPAWLHALEKEILLYKDRFSAFDTLYIGGGTPTVLDNPVLVSLITGLLKHFHFTRNAEITIEANPNDITQEKLKVLCSLGVNRISLGVQSFNDAELAVLQRRHTAREARRALEMLRSCGFANIGVDLIYGIPGQSSDAWFDTLSRALTFLPEHISCYQLTIAEGTSWWNTQQRDRSWLLDESASETFFLATAGLLEENGYQHYEVSNFARGKRYLSQHNQKYWQHIPYLGLGPSAHSFHNGNRWWNYRSVEKYCQALEEDNIPVTGSEFLSEEQRKLEVLYLGLRTKAGLDLSQFPATAQSNEVLPALLQEQYLEIVKGRVLPTRKGLMVADRLPLAFM